MKGFLVYQATCNDILWFLLHVILELCLCVQPKSYMGHHHHGGHNSHDDPILACCCCPCCLVGSMFRMLGREWTFMGYGFRICST
ncbi:hypothetical protein J5N97_013864 [Dioscorea zingiberensis]|uniref:Secreted protein n=1 Tax=Dioscorea zingiberensis TaxID=325984 RepID=A0A9D5HJ14_9LILI|nr:hypothetical protein J5N97_013864 [Dioscorea zingiberensis]